MTFGPARPAEGSFNPPLGPTLRSRRSDMIGAGSTPVGSGARTTKLRRGFPQRVGDGAESARLPYIGLRYVAGSGRTGANAATTTMSPSSRMLLRCRGADLLEIERRGGEQEQCASRLPDNPLGHPKVGNRKMLSAATVSGLKVEPLVTCSLSVGLVPWHCVVVPRLCALDCGAVTRRRMSSGLKQWVDETPSRRGL